MTKNKIKSLFFICLISFLLFLLSQRVYAQQEILFTLSLDWQSFIQNFLQKFYFPKDADPYKEKYYELLQELAKLKLTLKQITEEKLIVDKEKYLPNIVESNILKVDTLGYIYVQNPGIGKNTLVLDQNWSLVGKVVKITKDYLVIASLNVPGIEFNTADLNGQLVGLGKTISNGFVEINFVDPNLNLKINDFILTYGDDNYPAGFVIGTISKINNTRLGQQAIVKVSFTLNSGKVLSLIHI